ncbi:MAG TPA: DUF4492 domain-containing protein [Bacteroidales bacterium]|nr:DUF4492 domain-containing protein [Bacteroidales bacterium]
MSSFPGKIWEFYYNGFRNLSWWGKRMWLIILIKIFIIFAILKVFFFHDFLAGRFDSDEEKGNYVMEQLINPR